MEITITVYANGEYLVSLTVNGINGKTASFIREIKLEKGGVRLTAAYPQGKLNY